MSLSPILIYFNSPKHSYSHFSFKSSQLFIQCALTTATNKIKLRWSWPLIYKVQSVVEAHAAHFFLPNSSSWVISTWCLFPLALSDMYVRYNCHHPLKLKFDACDVLACIIHETIFDSHHNKSHCHVWFISCRYDTMNRIQLPHLLLWKFEN